MAFCSRCGNHLEGNERFCVKCGADLAATPPSATAPTAPVAPVAPIPQYAAPPAGYPAGGPVPVAVTIPAAQRRAPWGWIAIVVILAGIAFYYYHKEQTLLALIQNAINSDGSNGGGNNNSGGGNNGGGGGNNGGNNNSGGGPNLQQLMQQQNWATTGWNLSNGVVLVEGTWDNTSATNLATGTLVCTEYDANSNQIGTMSMHITGPINANTTYTWNTTNPLNMGAPVANLQKLGCGVTAVTV